jgi:hypothetical protein
MKTAVHMATVDGRSNSRRIASTWDVMLKLIAALLLKLASRVGDQPS